MPQSQIGKKTIEKKRITRLGETNPSISPRTANGVRNSSCTILANAAKILAANRLDRTMTANHLICVIDDDASVRRTICLHLETAGFQTVEASDGAAGLELIKTKQPAVAIVDIIMPGREGLSTIQEIRDEYPDTRILAISGGGIGGADRYLQFAESLGAHDTMMKPLRAADLVERIRRLISMSSAPTIAH
ncbi:MAG: response regulator [Alphaproteobacteria bacterium]|nr:response regulator [Alphaproteobacteria bacterium]